MPGTETDDQRRVREAEDRGRRQQVVDGRLEQIETNMRTHAAEDKVHFERIASTQERTEGKVDKLAKSVETGVAVNKALAEQAKDVSDRQVTSRQFFTSVAGVVVLLLSILIPVLVATGHG